MCGIFGAVFVKSDAVVDVDAALESMAYRGPDERGVYRKPGVILGHLRLSILDLTPAARQPMSSDDGGVVVFNGEIYNHHELRRELLGLGHTFRSRSDTEVIVEGYRAWGDEVVSRLDGMFAIGIWDGARRRLVLARDRAGKKPLFYTRQGSTVRFASEVKAIIASGVAGEIEPESLPSMLSLGYVEAPRSMYRGVFQLEPASLLVAEEGKALASRCYWRAPFAEKPLEVSTAEASQNVRTLLEAAVTRRLEADVPLGAFLSGGIDSTIVVGMMARATGQRVKTFSIGFAGDPRFDETHYARIAARRFGTEHTEFTLEPSAFDLVERLVAAHDGPFGDSSAIPTSVVSGLTRRHVTVALSGDGGDELFCGYTRFLAAEIAERLPVTARQAGASLAQLMPRGRNERTLVARSRRFLSNASLPLADRMLAWNPYFAFQLEEILRPELARALSLDAPKRYFGEVFSAANGASALSRILDHNFKTYLPYDLLVKADRASMIHSLEVRSPFLDTALVEYVARLPDSLKRRGTSMKWILKRACRDLLPDEILRRGKMGFGVPLGAWFRGDLKSYLLDRLGPTAEIHEWINRKFVERLLEQHFAGRADFGHRIWLLLTFEIWLRSLEKRATRAGRPETVTVT